VARALVDTGAVVALINRADRFHAQAAAWFRGFRGRLLTTEAVITETAYVLAASPQHQLAALTWIQRAREAGILQVAAMEDHAALARIISKYADLPCDYADASLIWRLLCLPGARPAQVPDPDWRPLMRSLRVPLACLGRTGCATNAR
jgi:predicted nucleic acid-binding protein